MYPIACEWELMPWAPALHDAGQQCLLGIVSDIWAKPINDLSEMTIRKTNNVRCCHARFERLQDFSERRM